MPLVIGARLGPYEIVSPLGAGGMGEVYRARDTKLKRDVAIKVLPDALAHDADRLARFQREAEFLAALNHPNIAAVYGLEESDGITALVLELVEGETLAEKISHGSGLMADGHGRSNASNGKPSATPHQPLPSAISHQPSHGLPVVEALAIARQVADALESAHDKGVIHRDLKPANIKVTPEGKVKVLDFGLAKLVAGEAGGFGPSGVSMSPTLSLHATYAGMILGTAAYMSPEQARGKPVDRRTDIWAFGCVLFEMLSGRQLFASDGDSVSDAIAAVLKTEPDWTALPSDTPFHVRTLLRRCLQKDVQKRLPHIGLVRIELDDPPPEAEHPASSSSVDVNSTLGRLRQRLLPWAFGIAGLVAAAVMLGLWAPWRTTPFRTPTRLTAEIGADATLTFGNSGSAAILSPDDATVVFVGQGPSGRSQLFIRRLDQLRATALSGTDDAASPFFSPDGQWIAFFAGGKLKKISVTGGAAVALCDVPAGRGGSWGDDGAIVYTPANNPGVSLMRVSAAGGKPEPLLKLADGEVTQRFPQVLPGAKAVLFMGANATGGYEDANIVVQPLPEGARKILVRGGYYPRYVRSGHVLYVHEGTLFAQPFDVKRLEPVGPSVPVIEGVATGGGAGAQYDVSPNGTLVYVAGEGFANVEPMAWMDRDGKLSPLRATPSDWADVNFAPDGQRLAVDINDSGKFNIWIYEWARDTLSRLTLEGLINQRPVWTPDSRRLAFGANRSGFFDLYWQRADGTGDVQRLVENKNVKFPTSFHPSGKFLAYHEVRPETNWDVMILPIEGDETTGWKPGSPTPFANTSFIEMDGMFSPDGRWIAYTSLETGRFEVYVRPFPGPGGKWPISSGGGASPTWSRSRRELFYATNDQQLMIVPYSVDGDAFRADKPRLWSPGRYRLRPRGAPSRSFDLHPDGNRFAVAPLGEAAVKRDKVVFVFNFFDELRRLAPPARR